MSVDEIIQYYTGFFEFDSLDFPIISQIKFTFAVNNFFGICH